MDPKRVQKIGKRIYAMSIHDLKRTAVYKGAVLGFDAEYDSKTKKLLSVQLHYGGQGCAGKGKGCLAKGCGAFIPTAKMSPELLVRESVKVIGKVPEKILLVSYFSLAELQFLNVKTGALSVREYARGSLDVTFLAQNFGGIEIEIFDLARWYDFSALAKAAESIGEEKIEFDRVHMSRKILFTKKGKDYAVHDAYLSDALCLNLRAAFAEGGIDILCARTPANASSQVFRLHFGPGATSGDERWYCDRNRARFAACMGTWGGRAEVFARGRLKGKFHEHDIMGAYPNAAVQIGRFPTQGSWHQCQSLGCTVADTGSFCSVGFDFPKGTVYPCLPVQTPEGSMLYPLRGESWATGYEVKLALEMGASIRLLESWGYRKGTPALALYMQRCLEARKTAKGAARTMYKLLANSLIGKFAQQTDRLNVAKLYELSKLTGVLIEDLCEMSFQELREIAEAEGIQLEKFSLGPVWMPEWNGLITGFTRARLGRALWKNGAVYCHTDSIWSGSAKADPGWEIKGRGKVTVARTRFAALWTNPPKIVHHSVWTRNVGEQMLKKFTGREDVARKYPKSRPRKFREAVKSGETVGRWIEEGEKGFWHRADTRWDGKRFLLPGGETRPWENLAEYLAWKETEE